MSEWIRLNAEALNVPRQIMIGSVPVTIQLSPHDVPVAIRGVVLPGDGKKILVEFRYLDEEPWKLERRDDGVAVRVGRHSKRMYGVELDLNVIIPKMGLVPVKDHVPEFVETVIDKYVPDETPSLRNRMADNFLVAKAAIVSVRSTLFAPA